MLARSTQGFADGDGDQAQFRCSHGIYWNPHDKCLYLCDRGNNAIRRITLQGSFAFSFQYLFTSTNECTQDKSARSLAQDWCLVQQE